MVKNNYNYFIKDFETVRSILKNLYIYGSYNKKQFLEVEGIKGKKYDNEMRRLRYFIDGENRLESKVDGKKVVGLKYDRYQDISNFLVNAYTIKTFNSQDINLHFFILQVLQQQEQPLTVNEIILEIQTSVLNQVDEDQISHRMMKAKLDEMCDLALLQQTSDKPYTYTLTQNILSNFSDEELNRLVLLLYFYRNTLPISVPFFFLQDTITDFITYQQGDDVEAENLFLFKHIFFQNIMNDQLIDVLSQSFFNHKIVTITIDEQQRHDIVPLKLILDRIYGRQYLFCFDLKENRVMTYQLRRLSKASLTKVDFCLEQYQDYLSLISQCYSMTQLNDVEDPMHAKPCIVEIEFHIPSDKKYLLKRIHLEKRQGELTEMDDEHWLYSIEVLSPWEMIPWIRSFGEFALVKKSTSHDLFEKIYEDWEGVLAKYGSI